MLLDLSRTKSSTVIVVQRLVEDDFCKLTFYIFIGTESDESVCIKLEQFIDRAETTECSEQ